MNYDKSRVYTALNAEELNPGDECFFASTIACLEDMIAHFDADNAMTLSGVRDKSFEMRFLDQHSNAYAFAYLIAGKPTYRPYENINEMIEDWKARFNNSVPNYAMPLIWVASKTNNSRYLVASFYDGKGSGDSVLVGDDYLELEELFTDSTYLDGSPCGKKIEVK